MLGDVIHGRKDLGGSLGCVGGTVLDVGDPFEGALAELATEEANEGIYQVVTADGLPYVGQSGNIDARLAQHVASRKISSEAAAAATRTEVLGGKTAREIAGQQRINELTNGVGASDPGIANIRNPIGPARQYLLPP